MSKINNIPHSLRYLADNLLLTVVVLIIFFTSIQKLSAENINQCKSNPVIQGVTDLRCWNGRSPIILSGSWSIEYESLDNKESYSGLASVPGNWRTHQPKLHFLGRAVYRNKIILSEPTGDLAINLKRSRMARKLILINELGEQTLLYDSGNTELSQKTEVLMSIPIVYLPPLGKVSELVLIVNNSESFHGGIEEALILGSSQEILRSDQSLKNITMIIATVLFGFFIVNLYLYFIRHTGLATLMLAGMAFSIVLRQIIQAGVLSALFPALTSSYDAAFGWGTFFFGLIFGYGYFQATFPKIIPKWIPIFVYSISMVGIVLFILKPLYLVQIYGLFYRPTILITTIVLIGYLIFGSEKSKYEVRITLFSGFILLLAVASDIILFQLFQYYSIVSISALGMLVFIAAQTMMTSNRYWNSLTNSAKLATELKILNSELENIVDKRTKELALKNRQLEAISRTDPLTGLANRRAFDELLNKEINRCKRANLPLVLALLDIDHFKQINDQYGHDFGDMILIDVGKRIESTLRINDFAARWGGEEFAALLSATNKQDALLIAQRIKQSISALSWVFEEQTVRLTISIGLARLQPHEETNQLFKQADTALYESKHTGRNKVSISW